MKITVLDDYQDTVRTLPAFQKVAHHDVTIWNDHLSDNDALVERLKDTEALALIRERTHIQKPLIERLPKLRIISQVSAFPHVDAETCTRCGVIISSNQMPAEPSHATAELTWGLVIAAMRRIPQEMAALQAGNWQAYPIGSGIYGKTLGIGGYGKLGKVIAGYGRVFGMKVLVFSREESMAAARADGYETVKSKEELFEKSDVLSVHLRLVDATRGWVTASDLARMKPTALFVNTSRAGLVEPGALAAALKAGRPGMAAVDVFEQEPHLGAKDPLLHLPNMVATPHLGFVERDALAGMFDKIFDQINAYAEGKPIHVANPAALSVAR
jgi:D-3-phosphoglycerate dehydrogenase